MYDVRLRDSWPSCGMNWPPDLADVTPYLRVNLPFNCADSSVMMS